MRRLSAWFLIIQLKVACNVLGSVRACTSQCRSDKPFWMAFGGSASDLGSWPEARSHCESAIIVDESLKRVVLQHKGVAHLGCSPQVGYFQPRSVPIHFLSEASSTWCSSDFM